MNYFELYGIPVTLSPDASLVKKKFYELSRQFHPDFHGQATEEEQAAILEKAAQVNRAYKIFNNREETIRYVLQEKGLLEEEEKYRLPQDFLMEMMELNEQVMEINGDDAKKNILDRITELKKESYEPVEKIVAGYQEGVTSEKELLQVKEYYFRNKYLEKVAVDLR